MIESFEKHVQDLKDFEKYLQALKTVLENVSLKEKNEKFLEVLNLARAYCNDAEFFKNKNELLKALELEAYAWGLLDALAILKVLNVPKELQKWFKTEF